MNAIDKEAKVEKLTQEILEVYNEKDCASEAGATFLNASNVLIWQVLYNLSDDDEDYLNCVDLVTESLRQNLNAQLVNFQDAMKEKQKKINLKGVNNGSDA